MIFELGEGVERVERGGAEQSGRGGRLAWMELTNGSEVVVGGFGCKSAQSLLFCFRFLKEIGNFSWKILYRWHPIVEMLAAASA